MLAGVTRRRITPPEGAPSRRRARPDRLPHDHQAGDEAAERGHQRRDPEERADPDAAVESTSLPPIAPLRQLGEGQQDESRRPRPQRHPGSAAGAIGTAARTPTKPAPLSRWAITSTTADHPLHPDG